MSKRVIKTLKMSIMVQNTVCAFTDIVVISAISECKVFSLHKYAGAMPWMDLYIKIDMK